MKPLTKQQAEELAMKILYLVAHRHEDKRTGSFWWEGMDTNCGTDTEVVGEAVAYLQACGVVDMTETERMIQGAT